MAYKFLLNFKLTLLIILIGKENIAYKIPSVEIEIFKERGFKISIPDDPGIQRIFFMMIADESCPALMDYITQATNDSWSSTQHISLQNNDKLQVSVLVQYNDHIYEKSETLVVLNTRLLNVQQSSTRNIITKNINRNNGSECQLYLSSDQRLSKQCKPTSSIVNSGSTSQGICQGALLFEDNFSEAQLNTSVWMYDIRQRMYHVEEELVAFEDSPQISYLREGHLHIVPTVASEVTEGAYQLGDRCTAIESRQLECSISKGSFHKIKPPVYSAQLHTRESFNFKYGKIVI
ncbi:gram-negative bacteria-binding protein 2 isoform X2 [Drosophila hydei]|uniref:Gram-negative bacteria-binding protein 2 isoform X2 n=1 Tax=Drosophila hydei TaxID=7224 RepID=A0A6J1LAD6_DROHY|nr:gram-negative bacteria-binding protein 2 isoform X2 [Drosophila hydei]